MVSTSFRAAVLFQPSNV